MSSAHGWGRDVFALALAIQMLLWEVKFLHPLFENDTVHATTEIVAKRESKSRPDAGIIEFYHRAYNQDGKLVAECRRQARKIRDKYGIRC